MGSASFPTDADSGSRRNGGAFIIAAPIGTGPGNDAIPTAGGKQPVIPESKAGGGPAIRAAALREGNDVGGGMGGGGG